jgi:hypothetical protein
VGEFIGSGFDAVLPSLPDGPCAPGLPWRQSSADFGAGVGAIPGASLGMTNWGIGALPGAAAGMTAGYCAGGVIGGVIDEATSRIGEAVTDAGSAIVSSLPSTLSDGVSATGTVSAMAEVGPVHQEPVPETGSTDASLSGTPE